jgi:uncharacterized protein YlxW (UPF0749 family)
MNQASSGLLFYAKERPMSTVFSNISNAVIYGATLGLATVANFIENNWYLLIMVVFGGVHVYIALSKKKRDDVEAAYKIKDRQLLIDREEERQRLAEEIIKKNEQMDKDIAYTIELEKARNREHSNTRAELYLDHPEKRRSPLKSIGNDK